MNNYILELVIIQIYNECYKKCKYFNPIIVINKLNNWENSYFNTLSIFPLVSRKFNLIYNKEYENPLCENTIIFKKLYNKYYNKYSPIIYNIFHEMHLTFSIYNKKNLLNINISDIFYFLHKLDIKNDNLFKLIRLQGFEFLNDLLIIAYEEQVPLKYIFYEFTLYINNKKKCNFDFAKDIQILNIKYGLNIMQITKILNYLQ